jgi:hypothetical protein
MKKWIVYPLLLLSLAIVARDYVTGYRSSALYRCQELSALTFYHPYIPLVGRFMPIDSLEVYVGGWIERGTLTISGDVLDQPLSFSATERTTTIAHARMGEWYQSNFTLTFKPEPVSSCRVRVVYRFRGIF